jgi:hypothetical protein
MPGKTLVFPPKTDWPKFTDVDWNSDKRHAFLKFRRFLASMFTALDFLVGNESYGGDWALIYDTAARKAHLTYPPPTAAPRRRLHRQTQLFLHRVLLDPFSDHCPAIIADHLDASTYDDEALQDNDGHPHCVGTALLQAIERHCVPTDDEASMTVQAKFENMLKGFPGVISVSSFKQLETWANETAAQWNRLSPYDQTLRAALPRYLQMLNQQLRSRKMANLDRIDKSPQWLDKSPQWLAKNDIPVYLSSLIAFASSQLDALAQAEGMAGVTSSSKRTATAAFADSTDKTKRQRFAEWGAQVAASVDGGSTNTHGSSSACSFCGRHHSLAQCRGVQNLIAQHKSRQLAARGGISKPPFHRGSSWRTKKPVQFGTRARPPFADRGGRSGGGNGVAGSNSGGSGGHWGNGHHGRRGSPSGRSPRDDSRRHLKRGGFSPRPTPRFHTNNVSLPEQGDDAAVRQILQANSASPSTPADRPTEPWQDVYTDLSGKVRTASVTGAKYFAVFVDSYSGSKHIEFMSSKNHFIFGYKRFVSYLGRHPKTLRSDQGTEILNKELTAYLEANHTNHIVCSKDEHASIGAAENSIGVLRTSAKAMMLAGNIPKRYWQFVVSHAAYLNNIVAPSRCDRTKTIFEILFGRRADVRRIPPIGAFCAVYADRRQLQDQSFGLTSKQGVFIGIARYKKVLGYVVTDGKSLFVTRDHITFDPQLFPFKLKPTSSPDWQTFYNLTNPVAEGAVLHKSPSATPENPMPDYASDESDLDPDFDSSQNPESADINDTPTYESSSDDDSPDNDSARIHTEEESPTNLTRPSRARQPVQRYKTTHTPRPPRSQTPSEILWHTDPAHRQERLSWIGKDVSKFFPTHGTFKGKVQQYHYASDNYTITYEDNDVERVTCTNMKRVVPGTPEYADHQSIVRALHVAFTIAVTDATSTVNSDVIPNSYKEARASIEAAGWQQSMDEEMTNLRKLGCWTVIPRSSLPPNTPIMGTRWTYRKKTDENGTFTRYRGRLVAKGFSQILGVNYFESFSPVASFVTIRTLFALTALPMFKVYQYDVQVAFIQSVIDPNHPPVYCEPAEGYEDRRHYVYQLHKHLYGMKDSPRGWSKLFTSVCLKYGFSQLKSDECVFVKIVPNTKSGKSASTFSAVLDTLPNVPEHERIYKDCPYESCLIILCSYVDDILAFTNCQSLADDFLAHCNKRFTITCDGEAHWYLSVKYTRDPSGAVSASQELYIDKILKRWGMESCKPLPTPFPAKSDVVLDELLKPIKNPDPVLNKQFQEIIGQLLYCQQQTVPEISWSVSILARFTTKAGAPHMALAKKVLRYLQGRKRIPLRWCARSCQQPHLPGHIYGYADASFADIKPDRLSSMGYVFIINNGAVSWRSTRTPLVTLSAAESEIIALSAATQEAVYLRKLANELGFTQTSPTTLYEDCTAAVALSKENRFRNRSKHIALRWSFVSERQHPSVGDIQVISVSRKIMLADIFASPRPAASFIPFRDSLLGRTSRITPLDSRDASTPDDDASSDE